MLQEVFPHLVTDEPLPSDPDVWEGSRFCLDKNLAPAQRRRAMQELVIAYLEYSLTHGITHIVGLMLPIYWRNVFINNGCPISWLGDFSIAGDGKKVRAGKMAVNKDTLNSVKEKLVYLTMYFALESSNALNFLRCIPLNLLALFNTKRAASAAHDRN